nr:FimV/HubP family polar landmark protein [Neisseria canis]
MTAPLEAKYELAQMYIEIGDPEAARETLNELVEEASGDILAKSKALLAELG